MHLKHLIKFFLSSIFIIMLFLFLTNVSKENTQIIITIPDLTVEDLSNLNKEFKRHNIKYIDGSVEGGTIAINVDENITIDRIENMLNKWNCKASDYDYINIMDVAAIE